MIELEVHGLELFGHHGVEEAERRDGQWFTVDVTVAVADPETDAIEAAVDYREVAASVRRVVEGEAVQLLETLAARIADDLLTSFAAASEARVRVAKPALTLEAGGVPRVSAVRTRP